MNKLNLARCRELYEEAKKLGVKESDIPDVLAITDMLFDYIDRSERESDSTNLAS
jgi:hypothetical protein